MSKMLPEIAQQLRATKKRVQVIYAFNGTGKTRLSRAFKELIGPQEEEEELPALARKKILYYNAYTEDLFYWDNDLSQNDLSQEATPKLKIQRNEFTDWLLKDLGQEGQIARYFQQFVNNKLTPNFNEDFSEVTFSIESGDKERSGPLKTSKGEESIFIWSLFYTLLEQVVETLKVPEPDDRETQAFDELEYIFIDDPVSSLDENHLIELAVDLARIIKESPKELKFIITTHNPLFYNILYNELGRNPNYLMLQRNEDGGYFLDKAHGDSNRRFSYHLHLKNSLELALINQKVERYHFTLLRNLYEKTASFLGYEKWGDLLPGDKKLYLNRIINFTSHSTLSNDVFAEPTPAEKETVKFLLDHLTRTYGFCQQEEKND